MSKKIPIASVRRSFCRNFKMLSGAAHASTFIETPGLMKKTGGAAWACDRYWRIYFDPEVLIPKRGEKDPMVTHVCSLYHELWHLLRGHHGRGEGRDRNLWLRSTDYSVNSDIFIRTYDEDFKAGRLLDPATRGWPYGKTAEWYYEKEKEEEEKGKEEEEEEGPSGPGRERGKEGPGEGGPGKGKGKGGNSPGEGDGPGGCCGGGSGAGGEAREWELGPPDSGEGSAPGLSSRQGDRVRRRVAEDVRKAVESQGSRSRGTALGEWGSWAGTVLAPPQKDWKAELQSLFYSCVIKSVGGARSSYRVRNRRQSRMTGGLRLAGTYTPRLIVHYVEDNSASVSNKDLETLRAEVGGLARAAGGGVTYIACDTEVSKVERNMRRGDVLKGRSSGGTDMRVGVRFSLQDKPRPNIIVVGTDGYTPWPEKEEVPAGTTVLAVLVGRHCGRSRVPSWIPTVELSNT